VTGARIGTVLGVAASALVILFCAWFGVTTILEATGRSAAVAARSDGVDWSAYPGSAWSDADAALDAPSEEELTAASAALTAEIRDAISAEFDVEWTPVEANPSSVSENGYGGDSLLHHWRGERFRGEVPLPDADARERVQQIIEEVGAEHGVERFSLSNDRDNDYDDPAREFGSVERESQAYWQSLSEGGPHPAYSLFAEVYDSSFPTAGDYSGWTPRTVDGAPIDGEAPTLYISYLPSAVGVLSDDVRAEYEERLAGYAGLEKPDGEF